jgi:hypothetical protein
MRGVPVASVAMEPSHAPFSHAGARQARLALYPPTLALEHAGAEHARASEHEDERQHKGPRRLHTCSTDTDMDMDMDMGSQPRGCSPEQHLGS